MIVFVVIIRKNKLTLTGHADELLYFIMSVCGLRILT